ncbi:MAG: hypothetical protein AAF745_16480 [Planctomycetota bacterium]
MSTSLVCGLATTFSAPASATIVTDVAVDAVNAPNPFGELGGPLIDEFQSVFQTFTVGIGGILDRVELQVRQSEPISPGDLPNAALSVSILETVGGVPDFTSNLGSTSLSVANIPAFDGFTGATYTAFDFSGLGITVSPGDVLAIEVSSPSTIGSYFVWDSEVNVYDGGTSFSLGLADGFLSNNSPRDLGFRTLVAIPEPSSFGVIVFLGIAWRCRRKRCSALKANQCVRARDATVPNRKSDDT